MCRKAYDDVTNVNFVIRISYFTGSQPISRSSPSQMVWLEIAKFPDIENKSCPSHDLWYRGLRWSSSFFDSHRITSAINTYKLNAIFFKHIQVLGSDLFHEVPELSRGLDDPVRRRLTDPRLCL